MHFTVAVAASEQANRPQNISNVDGAQREREKEIEKREPRFGYALSRCYSRPRIFRGSSGSGARVETLMINGFVNGDGGDANTNRSN